MRQDRKWAVTCGRYSSCVINQTFIIGMTLAFTSSFMHTVHFIKSKQHPCHLLSDLSIMFLTFYFLPLARIGAGNFKGTDKLAL